MVDPHSLDRLEHRNLRQEWVGNLRRGPPNLLSYISERPNLLNGSLSGYRFDTPHFRLPSHTVGRAEPKEPFGHPEASLVIEPIPEGPPGV